MTKLPVIFRKDLIGHDVDGNKQHEIVAVFPTEYDAGYNEPTSHMMACYAHIGQHGQCSLSWYHTTKAAKPKEYADLLAELKSIYERGPDAVELVVYKRRPPHA